jgi:6-phosphogluconolactonase
MAAGIPLVAAVPALAAEFARRANEFAAHAILQRGRFSLAIPGGSVAQAFLPVLAAAAIDWRGVDVFWCDERGVPPEDPASNYALARSLWLGAASADAPRVHRLAGEAPDASHAAAAAARELERSVGTPPVLDLVLLGVGEDGHVASLFPGHPALEERERWIVDIVDAPKPPPSRLTMTLPTLTGARNVCIAAFGAAKAGAMRAAIEDRRSVLPVARVIREAGDAWVFLDPAAASRLGGR